MIFVFMDNGEALVYEKWSSAWKDFNSTCRRLGASERELKHLKQYFLENQWCCWEKDSGKFILTATVLIEN